MDKIGLNAIRVAYITTVPVQGGAELNLLRVLPHLEMIGVTPAVILAPPGGGIAENFEAVGYYVRRFNLYRKDWRVPWRYGQSIAELVSPIVRARADIVHINHHYGLEYTTLAARLARRPYIVHVRAIQPIKWVTDNALYLTRATRIIAVSGAVKEALLRSDLLKEHVDIVCSGVQGRFLETVYDGTSPLTTDQGSGRQVIRRQLQVKETAPLVGLVARLERLKGVTDFLLTGKDLLQVFPDLKLVIVGTGESSYVAQLQALTSQLGMEDSVVFTGFRTDIPEILTALDVLVVATYDPLTGQGEAFPNIVLEAMQTQTLVVARCAGGLIEILNEGRGILVAPEGTEPLYNGIFSALTMPPDERQTMVRVAYETVNTMYTLQNQAQKILSVYKDVVKINYNGSTHLRLSCS